MNTVYFIKISDSSSKRLSLSAKVEVTNIHCQPDEESMLVDTFITEITHFEDMMYISTDSNHIVCCNLPKLIEAATKNWFDSSPYKLSLPEETSNRCLTLIDPSSDTYVYTPLEFVASASQSVTRVVKQVKGIIAHELGVYALLTWYCTYINSTHLCSYFFIDAEKP